MDAALTADLLILVTTQHGAGVVYFSVFGLTETSDHSLLRAVQWDAMYSIECTQLTRFVMMKVLCLDDRFSVFDTHIIIEIKF